MRLLACKYLLCLCVQPGAARPGPVPGADEQAPGGSQLLQETQPEHRRAARRGGWGLHITQC